MTRLVVAIAVLVAACGGGDSVSLEDYPQEFRDAFCRNFVKCSVVKDLETCRKLNFGANLHVTASEQAAVDMGKATFNGDKAQACIDGIADASCDATSDSWHRALPGACGEVAIGTLHAGAACTLGGECISLQCSVPQCNMACCTGSCVGDAAPVLAKVGESCATVDCASGAFCDFSTDRCAALKPASATCGSDFECAYGLACLGSGATGTCTALPKLGEACQDFCTDFGATCSATSHMCVKVAIGGDACASDAVGNDTCSALYACDAGHCSGGVALGATCTSQDHCVDPRAFCDVPGGSITGTCVLPKANGMPCDDNSQCQSFACSLDTALCIAEPVCI